MTHFTYKVPKRNGDLQQGDVLRRTNKLEDVIGKFHRYYLKEDYTHFIILTQSCDLVRRGGQNSAKYITIAAVRPLAIAIDREVEKYRTGDLLRKADVISDRFKDKISFFLERLLNNNIHEYFYLHEDLSRSLATPACAFLRLSIAILNDHYETCRTARVASLEATFQAKLGWMVGDLYSRVGTDDWVPNYKNEAEWKQLIEEILKKYVVALPDRKITWAKKNLSSEQLATMDQPTLRQTIQSAPEWKKKDDVIAAVLEELKDVLDVGQVGLSQDKLKNSSILATLLK